MKRSIILAAVSTVIFVGFLSCGKPPVLCDGDSLMSKAQLCPDRDSIGFGREFGSGTFIGVTAFENLSLRNGGVETLKFSEVTVTGDDAFIFRASWDPDYSDKLIPTTDIIGAKTGFMEVRFKPTAAKEYNATLTITSNAENSPKKVFTVSGCGVPGDGGVLPACYCAPATFQCTATTRCCSGTCTGGVCQ